ncbi:MAG: hypothetical protein K0Q79_413 [Flavipsychrobacter sp.]|jgi:hypothetical protein|nr:hypothetical protein [Flavipsychrobacter sp.]
MSLKNLLWLLPLVCLAACSGGAGNSYYDNNPSAAKMESATSDSVAVAAADAPINSPKRKIIHTADFNCKVAEVFTATTKLENLVRSVGGIVQESQMNNTSYDTRTSYYTADSLRETKTYTPTATLTLRVPSQHIDSVVNAIPGMCTFVDSRVLKQSDVTYKYLANVLKNQVGNSNATKQAMKLAKKSHEPIQVQAYDNYTQEQRIDRKIENMNMDENINYATLTVALSQPEQVFVQTIVNPDYIAKTPFSLQCKSALNTGWELIKMFIVLCIRIWPLILVLIATLILVKRFTRRQLAVVKK